MKSAINNSSTFLFVASLTLWATIAPLLHPISPAMALSQATKVEKSRRQAFTPNEKVNVNTATFDTLVAIPGIGPKTAEKILDYRGKIGQFRTIEDLLEVKGIGVKTLEKIRPFVTL